MTDREIIERVASIAGWIDVKTVTQRGDGWATETLMGFRPGCIEAEQVPDYLSDAAAVIALLEGLPNALSDFYCDTRQSTPAWGIGIRAAHQRYERTAGLGVHAKGSSFCRVACEALIAWDDHTRAAS